MSNRKRSRRAVAAGLATATVAAAAPSGAEAAAEAGGCRWADGNRVTVFVDTAPPLNSGYATLVFNAAAGWNRSGYIDISGASSAEAANIVIRGGALQQGQSQTVHGTGAICVGQARITIDNNKILKLPHSLAVAQSVVSHEIGHALGLGDDFDFDFGPPWCGDEKYLPDTVMAAQIVIVPSGLCNPVLPINEDITAIDRRYAPAPVK